MRALVFSFLIVLAAPARSAGVRLPSDLYVFGGDSTGGSAGAGTASDSARPTRLLRQARHSLAMAEQAVKRNALGKKQKLTAACSADVERAIEDVRAETGR